MAWKPIRKSAGRVGPNLDDYDSVRARFTWDSARARLDGLPHGRGLNIAYEAIDRHAAGRWRDHVAVRCLRKNGGVQDLTFAGLAARSNQFANVLRALGVGKGDRVFTLVGRVPDLYVAALGTLKNGSVLCPLFSAFGPDPIRRRLTLGDGKVLVTTDALYHRKVAPVEHDVASLEHVLRIDRELPVLLDQADDRFEIPPTDPEDMALLHFTSGTTGTPKGAVHVHDAVVAHAATGAYALDLHADDVFWCTADPGWVTGISYGVIAPLTQGVTTIVDEAEFDAERWYRTLEEQRVSVWYTAPTAIRMLMKAGRLMARDRDLSALRLVATVGEPLDPEAVVWGEDVLGVPIHDTWWQTETGAVMIANYASMDIHPGSMGRPVPGVEATVLVRGAAGRARVVAGRVEEVSAPDVDGELALRRGWPSMFRGYLHDEARYEECFADGWYLTGDIVRRDAEGYFWFVGRADDVIKTAGHLVGPFEVETVLLEHPAVIEAGVVGKPDPVAGEVVKAYVTIRPGFEPSDDLRLELMAFCRGRLGRGVAPKEIDFDQHLPKTTSGKIVRRLLKAREQGLPTTDTGAPGADCDPDR